MSPVPDGRRLLLAGKALGKDQEEGDRSDFLPIRVLSDSTSLFTVPTCRTFEGDTRKFLGKASAGKVVERYPMFKVVML